MLSFPPMCFPSSSNGLTREKKIQMDKCHMKKSSTSLNTGEMQTESKIRCTTRIGKIYKYRRYQLLLLMCSNQNILFLCNVKTSLLRFYSILSHYSSNCHYCIMNFSPSLLYHTCQNANQN